ncbi:MAG: hypothetical protein RLZZ385_812 [Pseudomonadota bacterium]|jgi:malonyl-CoA decarboxylase
MGLKQFQEFMGGLIRRQGGLLFPKSGRDATTMAQLLDKIMGSSGEVSAMVVAREVLDRYKTFDAGQQLQFFQTLEQDFNADPARVRQAFHSYDSQPDSQHLQTLFAAAEPRRLELLRRLNQTAGATHDLVGMRADLLGFLKDHPQLAAVDRDFVRLFSSWFSRGFLVLQTINWSTSAAILERIIRYEAVHEIQDWEDLRRRIEPGNRRCFAFFHPALIDEPLIFVEVALSNHIPRAIQGILTDQGDSEAAEDYDTATFYSISNCQAGLKNISFGNFLIKQVVEELRSEFPAMKRFVTLSPMPGFRRWLEADDAGLAPPVAALRSTYRQQVNESDDPVTDSTELQQLAAHYLVNARSGRAPLDPVARFHLGNGARIHQLNPDADTSSNGRRQSLGMMVNYLYDLRSIERNHEQFMEEGRIDCSADILKLLKP